MSAGPALLAVATSAALAGCYASHGPEGLDPPGDPRCSVPFPPDLCDPLEPQTQAADGYAFDPGARVCVPTMTTCGGCDPECSRERPWPPFREEFVCQEICDPCRTEADCAWYRRGICESGRCVQCTLADQTDCGTEYVCDLATNRCVEPPG